jgi:hypothetical protein
MDGLRPKGVSSATTHYQVEVKSWSIHGVGGNNKQLPLEAQGFEVADYKKQLWGQYWSNGQFTERALNKVLTPMKPDPTWSLVEPIACVWTAMHPEGKEEEFFCAEPEQSRFKRVWVFSMSSFLRNIVHSEPQFPLHLPKTALRINWLRTLFSGEGA